MHKIQLAYQELLDNSKLSEPTELIGWSQVIVDTINPNLNQRGQS